ncbi:MAG: iron donor protein CyaY [Oligoflexia bacterium]|nr:iron donor protein CyaY [Oligoflexia bacterium]
MSEAEYRARIQEAFDRIERPLRDVDPDVLEAEQSQGALTLTFADRTRCILSAQPSVRQLWLALAAQGTAYHFNFDGVQGRWIDDKGRGIELLSFLAGVIREKTGLSVW